MVGGGRPQEERPSAKSQRLQPWPAFIAGTTGHEVVVHVDKRRTMVGVGTNTEQRPRLKSGSAAHGHVCDRPCFDRRLLHKCIGLIYRIHSLNMNIRTSQLMFLLRPGAASR
jgi:hypothetical protein